MYFRRTPLLSVEGLLSPDVAVRLRCVRGSRGATERSSEGLEILQCSEDAELRRAVYSIIVALCSRRARAPTVGEAQEEQLVLIELVRSVHEGTRKLRIRTVRCYVVEVCSVRSACT